MWFSICGDPDCPNKRKIEELEHEIDIQRKLLEEDSKEKERLRQRIRRLESELRRSTREYLC